MEYTLPKTNIAENGWLEDEISYWNPAYFQGICWFQGRYSSSPSSKGIRHDMPAPLSLWSSWTSSVSSPTSSCIERCDWNGFGQYMAIACEGFSKEIGQILYKCWPSWELTYSITIQGAFEDDVPFPKVLIQNQQWKYLQPTVLLFWGSSLSCWNVLHCTSKSKLWATWKCSAVAAVSPGLHRRKSHLTSLSFDLKDSTPAYIDPRTTHVEPTKDQWTIYLYIQDMKNMQHN